MGKIFWRVTSVFAAVVLFALIDRQSVYVLDPSDALVLVVGGIMMFFAYLALHRHQWGWITWIGWVVWCIPSVFLNAITNQHFMEQSDFTNVPPVMVQMAPYFGASVLIIALTALLFLTDFAWSKEM